MTRTPAHLALVLILTASAALAHQGVKNPDVKKRMDQMVTIRTTMATLGGMAQGKMAYDSAAAAAARAELIARAAAIPDLFETEVQSPKSEAAPTIWDDFDDFTDKADMLQEAAQRLDIASLDALRAGIGAVGRACADCHKAYRLEK